MKYSRQNSSNDMILVLWSRSGPSEWVCVSQVAIAQFSDDARTEFKLSAYDDKESLLDAIQRISYKGGNTKTGKSNPHTPSALLKHCSDAHECVCVWPLTSAGRAMQHVKDSVLTAVGGARRGVPKVLVVLTDGRSQDDVLQVSQEIQAEGNGPHRRELRFATL